MTRFDVAALPAPPDRTIDALIATRLFGWVPAWLKADGRDTIIVFLRPGAWTFYTACSAPVTDHASTPHFSTSWGHPRDKGFEDGAMAIKTWAAEDSARFHAWTKELYALVATRTQMPQWGDEGFDLGHALIGILKNVTPEDYCRAALVVWRAEQA